MNVLKSCLMVIGLIVVLFIGGCVMGAYSLGSAINGLVNPKEVTINIDQSPDKARKEIYRFLNTATDEETAKPVAVSPFSDGSVRLTYGNAEPYDLSVVIDVTPKGDGSSSKVHAKWDATGFSKGQSVTQDAINRAINKRVTAALKAIDKGSDVGTSMVLSAVVEDAKNDKLDSTED
jgi:hypothetical protein